MLAPHFSKSILFTATRSLRGTHFAAWTTAVAPYPKRKESCFKHCLILEMQIKTSKLYRWLPEAHIAPFCLAIFLRRQPPFCLATRRQCFTLTGWDCHWVTHWVGQEVLAKRKGPGNEFESKRTAAQAYASTFNGCNGSMRIGSYNKSGVVSYFSYIWITKTMFVNNNSK